MVVNLPSEGASWQLFANEILSASFEVDLMTLFPTCWGPSYFCSGEDRDLVPVEDLKLLGILFTNNGWKKA